MKTLTEQAEELKAKGSPLSIAQLIAFLEKQEAGKAKRAKRSAKAWERRDEMAEATEKLDAEMSNMSEGKKADYFEDVRRKSLIAQLPSSMRK